MSLAPHALLALVDLLFRNRPQRKVDLQVETVASLSGALGTVEVTVRRRGGGRARGG